MINGHRFPKIETDFHRWTIDFQQFSILINGQSISIDSKLNFDIEIGFQA